MPGACQERARSVPFVPQSVIMSPPSWGRGPHPRRPLPTPAPPQVHTVSAVTPIPQRQMRANIESVRQQPTPARTLADVSTAEHQSMIDTWVQFAMESGSAFVDSLPIPQQPHLQVLFATKASASLRRHISGWRRSAAFAAVSVISICTPTAAQLLDFVQGLASENGQAHQRRAGANSVVSAMNFMTSIIDLGGMAEALSSNLIRA